MASRASFLEVNPKTNCLYRLSCSVITTGYLLLRVTYQNSRPLGVRYVPALITKGKKVPGMRKSRQVLFGNSLEILVISFLVILKSPRNEKSFSISPSFIWIEPFFDIICILKIKKQNNAYNNIEHSKHLVGVVCLLTSFDFHPHELPSNKSPQIKSYFGPDNTNKT